MRRLSVIVPCRNERAFIDAFLDSLAAQRLPDGWTIEWLVADGDSNDGTRQRLDARARMDDRLVVVDNPRRIVSTGLNACLARARGDVIARMDVHTDYATDYLAQCIATLEIRKADNVGGPWIATGDQPMQRAIVAAFQSRWVVGGARSRDRTFEGPVETVYLGCWPRASFERFGNFDETLVRNQDDEHNLRIVRGGGVVWQSPAIRSTYRPRTGLARLFAQQRQYGYWRPFVLRKHGAPGSWRQVVPAAFIASLVVTLSGSPWLGLGPLVMLIVAYGLYLALVSLGIARSAGWDLLWRLPPAIAAYHVGYGLGTWQGLFSIGFGLAPTPGLTELTR
jgi:glycosyltransferase involved in cell wall biosynthesis